MPDYTDYTTFSTASGKNLHYVVLQVTLKEKFWGTGSGNLTDLEDVINEQAAKGYRQRRQLQLGRRGPYPGNDGL